MNKVITGDSLIELKKLADNSVNCCVTSPPYWGLRDYNLPPTIWPDWEGCLGLEPTPEMYVGHIVLIFKEVFRVLRKDGTLWLNLGDSYASDTKGSGGVGKSTLGAASGGHGISEAGIERSQKRQSMETRKLKHGLKSKDLVGIPWMVAFALRADGWYLRQDIIWHKPNPMPESVTDRCTKSHEYIFLLSKSNKYYYDQNAILEEAAYDGRKDTVMKGSKKYQNGFGPTDTNPNSLAIVGHERWKNKIDGDIPARNKRSVWTVSTKPFKEAHYAVFPQELIVDCIKAGCPEDGVVLDPFFGSGTTGLVANKLFRKYIGIELGEHNIEIANNRLYKDLGMFM